MKSFLQSFYYAWRGLVTALKEERNLKVQAGIALVTSCAGFYFQITTNEWALILICMALVLGFELMNSALENLVDLVTKDFHPLAGKAKDIAAGAVLIVSVISLAVGILIFRKYIL